MTLRQWLINLATQLGDYHPGNAALQFQHWPQGLLLSYYNDAACWIASQKPSDYIKTRIVKLQPGTTQVTCCALVGAVTEHVTSAGEYISTITTIKKLPTWRGSGCSSDADYSPLNAYRVDSDPDSFEIYPPVPSCGCYYVKIRCSNPPATLDASDLDKELPACKYSAALTEWALYRALSGETDTSLISNAQMHYKAFFDLLSIQQKAEQAFLLDAMTGMPLGGLKIK
jgi:hypothetical protein